MQKTSKESDLSKKDWVNVHLRELSTFKAAGDKLLMNKFITQNFWQRSYVKNRYIMNA